MTGTLPFYPRPLSKQDHVEQAACVQMPFEDLLGWGLNLLQYLVTLRVTKCSLIQEGPSVSQFVLLASGAVTG